MESDLQAGLKTIPLKLDKNKSILISYIALLMFFLISFFHYQSEQQWEILLAITISFIVTFFILYSKKAQNRSILSHRYTWWYDYPSRIFSDRNILHFEKFFNNKSTFTDKIYFTIKMTKDQKIQLVLVYKICCSHKNKLINLLSNLR